MRAALRRPRESQRMGRTVGDCWRIDQGLMRVENMFFVRLSREDLFNQGYRLQSPQGPMSAHDEIRVNEKQIVRT